MYGTRNKNENIIRFCCPICWLLSDFDSRHSIWSFLYYVKLLWLIRRHVHNRILQLVMLRMLSLWKLSDAVSIGPEYRRDSPFCRTYTHTPSVLKMATMSHIDFSRIFRNIKSHCIESLCIFGNFLLSIFSQVAHKCRISTSNPSWSESMKSDYMSQILVLLINNCISYDN